MPDEEILDAAPTNDSGVDVAPQLEAPSAPEDLLDPSLYGDFKVPVKVNGQEQYVPFREVQSGYMMQSDYTRKTQEVASERARLAQAERLMMAMESDPEGTLQALNEAFKAQNGGSDDLYDEDVELSTEQRELAEIKAWKQSQEQRETDAYIASQVANLKASYGDFDQDELFDFMVSQGISDFDMAYGAMNWKKQQRRTAADAATTGEKRALPPIAGGRGVAAGSIGGVSSGPPQSFSEAAEAAYRELGY